ncbi:hypothetical protein EIP91_001810 [Steccherinum ochraceum]|uniref:Carboxypeptidase n=1 Tax=Steccherinum ochraceum TaxID=92696 RepID=A0A4R0RXK5_9APHY|nr:hypothetical protein EIP91_001810 [Steccherinum ochraceum]
MLLTAALVTFSSLLFSASSVTSRSQQVLATGDFAHPGTFDQYDAGLFSPVENLQLLSAEQFTTLWHPTFPKHSVRVKKSRFCDGAVDAYTGYIDIEARHLFFYFFESRGDPEKDDVIFWTSGGPGGSSSLGLFMELGPCRVVSDNATIYNPYAWNSNANVFFVDQPVGVGFSYAEHGESVDTSQDAGKDIAAFVAIFFEHFSKFKGRPFHMAGESYGGTYVPAFAAAVYDQNTRLKELGMTPVNLSSIMLGNGCTDMQTMMPAYHDMQCTNNTVPPVTDIATCVHLKQLVPRCEKWLRESCFDTFDHIACGAAMAFCEENLVANTMYTSGLNPYDLRTPCDGKFNDRLCYPIFKQIGTYLNTTEMRTTIGADSAVESFEWASWEVNTAFAASMDIAFPSQHYITALLERGVRVLVYVGDTDFMCNWIGNDKMTLSLEWTGKNAFTAAPLREWKVGGVKAGVARSFGGLTFATISEAGHMVPYDQPERSLELTRRWLAGEEI